VADAEFRYSDLLPTGQDDTPYRLITTEKVSTFEANAALGVLQLCGVDERPGLEDAEPRTLAHQFVWQRSEPE